MQSKNSPLPPMDANSDNPLEASIARLCSAQCEYGGRIHWTTEVRDGNEVCVACGASRPHGSTRAFA